MGGPTSHSKQNIGKSSRSSPIPVLILWSSIYVCILFVYTITLLNVVSCLWCECCVHVSHGFPKKVWIGVGGRELYPILVCIFGIYFTLQIILTLVDCATCHCRAGLRPLRLHEGSDLAGGLEELSPLLHMSEGGHMGRAMVLEVFPCQLRPSLLGSIPAHLHDRTSARLPGPARAGTPGGHYWHKYNLALSFSLSFISLSFSLSPISIYIYMFLSLSLLLSIYSLLPISLSFYFSLESNYNHRSIQSHNFWYYFASRYTSMSFHLTYNMYVLVYVVIFLFISLLLTRCLILYFGPFPLILSIYLTLNIYLTIYVLYVYISHAYLHGLIRYNI